MIGSADLPPDALAHLAAGLPDCLANAAARNRVAALVRDWPGGTAGQILELRLDGRGDLADASLAVLPQALGALAARRWPDPRLARTLDWAAASGHPRSTWLEWDLPPGPVLPDRPSLFLAVPQAGTWDFCRQTLTALSAVSHGPALRRVLDALPTGARLRQIGAMLARKEGPLRLVLDTGAPQVARALLQHIKPELTPVLDRLLALPGFAQAPRLDLDLTPDGPGPRLGVELPAAPLSPAALALVLSGLAAGGIIDAAAARALADHVAWSPLAPGLTAGLNHLKAAARADDPAVEVKAYLGLVPVPHLAPAVPA